MARGKSGETSKRATRISIDELEAIMAIAQTRIIHTSINVPFRAAYEFAWQPENFSKWASGLSDDLRHDDNRGWVATNPRGEAIVQFTPHNELGVLDHTVQFPDMPLIAIPLRMLPNGEGTEVELVLFRQAQMSDAEFEEDAAAVSRDLAALKAVLEDMSPG